MMSLPAILAHIAARDRPNSHGAVLAREIERLMEENERLREIMTNLVRFVPGGPHNITALLGGAPMADAGEDPYVRANRLSVEWFERDNQRTPTPGPGGIAGGSTSTHPSAQQEPSHE